MVQQPSGCYPMLVGFFTMLAALLCGGLVITETTGSPPEPVIESAESNSLLIQIDEAEAQWNEAGISSYTISVTEASFWGVQTNTVTVQDGEIIDQSATCINSPMQQDGVCEPKPFDPANYTIPGLFARARSSASIDDGQFTTVEFDQDYHFPSSISFNNPEILDEEWILSVESFELAL